MDRITILISFITISIIVTFLSITLTMTNVFGNNKPKVTTYDKPPILDNNYKRLRCIGPNDKNYKLYNDIILNKSIVLEECEGIVSESGNVKMVLQSDGRLVIYDENKENRKSKSVYGGNPFLLDNTGIIFNKDKSRKEVSFLSDLLKTADGRQIKINENSDFVVLT